MSRAQVVWDGQRNEAGGMEGQRVHRVSMWRDLGVCVGGGASAGPVTHNLRSACVKHTLLSSRYNVSACSPASPPASTLDTYE